MGGPRSGRWSLDWVDSSGPVSRRESDFGVPIWDGSFGPPRWRGPAGSHIVSHCGCFAGAPCGGGATLGGGYPHLHPRARWRGSLLESKQHSILSHTVVSYLVS